MKHGGEASVFGRAVHRVGEGCCWMAGDDALYTVDIWGCAVHRLDPASGAEAAWPTPGMACALAASAGRPVVALERRLVRLDPATGALTDIAPPPPVPASHRFNDATVDAAGRLVIGTMRLSDLGPAPTGELLSFDGARWTRLLDGFWTLNGLAFSPDGTRIFWSDSHPSVARVWAAPYDVATGALGPATIFADFAGRPGRPDGAAMAADGTYWIAGVGGGRLYAFAPDGTPSAAIELPVENPTRPAFGGAGLADLFVTSMSKRLTRPDPHGLAGRIVRLPDIGPGHPVPLFRSRPRP